MTRAPAARASPGDWSVEPLSATRTSPSMPARCRNPRAFFTHRATVAASLRHGMRMVSSVIRRLPVRLPRSKKKVPRKVPFPEAGLRYWRHEPGRYLRSTPLEAAGPQFQPYSACAELAVNTAFVLELASGVSWTTLLSTDPLMLRTVAWTTPLASVVMADTYLVAAVVLTSQPQPLTPGSEPPDWYTSVIEVRQALMARITSDIFARMV